MNFQTPSNSHLQKIETFVTVSEGRMCIGTQAIFREKNSKEPFELNSVMVLTNAQASRVGRILGFFPDEGYTHYVDEKQKVEL